MDSSKTHNSSPNVVSKRGKNGVKVCHQCSNWSGNVRLFECENCKSNSYCFHCFTKWYPNVPEKEFVMACPVCRNKCNCKTCDKQVKDLSRGVDGFQFVEVSKIVNDAEMNEGNNKNGWLSTESDGSQENKNDMLLDQEPLSAIIEDSGSSVPILELWQGFALRREVKELLQSIEQRYPTTFQGVKFRSPDLWLPILNQFYVVMKHFTDASVDSLTEDQITTLHEDLKEYESIKFDLSWAHKRLDMVMQLKYGNVPLQNELLVLESSLKPLEESVEERRKVYLEAHEKLKEAQLEYNGVTDALNKKRLDMEEKFGADYEHVLNGKLGFGLLPGY